MNGSLQMGLTIYVCYAVFAAVSAPLSVGLIRKIKARLQNRIGSPIWQPILDLHKLVKKSETLSDSASWIFRFAACFSAAIAVYLVAIMPWFTPKPLVGQSDIFVVLYLLSGMRLFALLTSMDTGSPFGAFAASREATLSFLVEPAAVLSLAALAIFARSSDLNVIFSGNVWSESSCAIWLLSGAALLLVSVVELSRMPIDDPTTHLELTMIHEAMILEASGPTLALFEFAHSLKLLALVGVSSQCFLRALPFMTHLSQFQWAIASLCMLIAVLVFMAVFESLSVKLNWRKAPEFIAYALSLSFIASLIALGGTQQ